MWGQRFASSASRMISGHNRAAAVTLGGTLASLYTMNELDMEWSQVGEAIERMGENGSLNRSLEVAVEMFASSSVSCSDDYVWEHPFAPRSSMVNCSDDGFMWDHGATPQHLLSRHHTIQIMEAAKTKDSKVREQYDVNWSKPLGQGAFGKVYSAIHRATGEKVAVKEISKKYTDDTSFQREMMALQHIRKEGGHPHICGLRENFEEDGNYYLILDLISGGELFDHLVKMGAFSEADTARLLREVASALAYLHGIGVVHGDMKPENVMLSSNKASNAIVKLVDFGCAEVEAETKAPPLGNTPAYCPPEVLEKTTKDMQPTMDMWALGVILYIMLIGVHPFDLNGRATDEEIEAAIISRKKPPLRDSPFTGHLSQSALEVVERLMEWDSKKRMTAIEMLENPWVQGKTAKKEKMLDSDKKLSHYHSYRTRLEAQVFANIVSWSGDDVAKRTSLLERSFKAFDPDQKGYLTTSDVKRIAKEETQDPMSFAGMADKLAEKLNMKDNLSYAKFSDMVSENMKNKYFPKNHVIYNEGARGDHMYFINSGTIEVTTKDGIKSRRYQGDFFGEGALMHPLGIRSATIHCVTPVHALEISREYFEKYVAQSEGGVLFDLKEKDGSRKRDLSKTILRLQNSLTERKFKRGDNIFKFGEQGNHLFILDEGEVDVVVHGHTVFTISNPGDMCGEHSLIFGRPRNSTAVCHTDSCKLLQMRSRDFYALLEQTPAVKQALRETCMRREFQKALVLQTNRPFPTKYEQLRPAFEAVANHNTGRIEMENVRRMLRQMDKSLSDEEIHNILKSLDLNDTGFVSYNEFEKIFNKDLK